jgi:CYTH domain-containing protein
VDDWRRAPGRGKYARVERERRFLVVGEPELVGEPRLIEDRYLDGTTLRLRRVTVGGESVHKLTQKVRWNGGLLEVSTTNTYLTAEEFQRLAVLPAAVLTKTRRMWAVGGRRFAVDEFHGALAGLVLAECEVASADDGLPAAPWLGTEVTYDERYSGASLARSGMPS